MTAPFNSSMLQLLMALLRGAIQLFGVYVLLHGHDAPGGGFVAGSLFAAGMILPRLLRGGAEQGTVLSARGALVLSALGILLFAGVAVAAIVFGGTAFDYAALPIATLPVDRRSIAALVVEAGVTMAVAGAMLSIFLSLSGAKGGEGR